jgi:hypothetical protein
MLQYRLSLTPRKSGFVEESRQVAHQLILVRDEEPMRGIVIVDQPRIISVCRSNAALSPRKSVDENASTHASVGQRPASIAI